MERNEKCAMRFFLVAKGILRYFDEIKSALEAMLNKLGPTLESTLEEINVSIDPAHAENISGAYANLKDSKEAEGDNDA
jgi:hypothetical protein